MKVIDSQAFEDICISDVTVISGVRPAGRSTDLRVSGREFHGILYIWSGEARFWEKEKESAVVRDGELLFIPKSHKYRMKYTAAETTFVLVNFDMFNKKGEEIGLSKDIVVLAKDSEARRIAGIMAKLELCGASKNLAAALRRKELTYRLLSVVYESNSLFTDKFSKVPQIFAGTLLLEQSYLDNIPISKFAEVSNISVSSFRSLFNKQYGMSPIQYRNRLRIDRAVALLSEGSCTVAEAAYASGFENIGYFCRYYKKITGETPSQTKAREL